MVVPLLLTSGLARCEAVLHRCGTRLVYLFYVIAIVFKLYHGSGMTGIGLWWCSKLNTAGKWIAALPIYGSDRDSCPIALINRDTFPRTKWLLTHLFCLNYCRKDWQAIDRFVANGEFFSCQRWRHLVDDEGTKLGNNCSAPKITRSIHWPGSPSRSFDYCALTIRPLI